MFGLSRYFHRRVGGGKNRRPPAHHQKQSTSDVALLIYGPPKLPHKCLLAQHALPLFLIQQKQLAHARPLSTSNMTAKSSRRVGLGSFSIFNKTSQSKLCEINFYQGDDMYRATAKGDPQLSTEILNIRAMIVVLRVNICQGN